MLTIPHSSPFLTEQDRQAVLGCLEAGYVGYDDKVEAEIVRELSPYFHFDAICTTPSASMSLLAILKHLDLQPHDEIILSAINCWSVYNLIKLEKITPVVCDVRSNEDFRTDYQRITAAITDNTKVILITHMFGVMVEESVLKRLKAQYPQIQLIEDCSTSLFSSASFQIGQYSDFAIASFGSTKPLTGGIGGVLCSRENIIDVQYDQQAKKGSGLVSLNTKLSRLNQALILSQLKSRAQVHKMRTILLDVYATFVPVYGTQDCTPFRAITFDDPHVLVAAMKTHGIALDIRNSAQPNVSAALGITANQAAAHFKKYYSLPLNSMAFDCFKDKGLIIEHNDL